MAASDLMSEQEYRATAIHPAIMGLLQLLPFGGQPFSKEARQTWLRSIAAALELIYGEEVQ